MDFPPNNIEAEHHLTAVGESSTILLSVNSLRPYLITQGRWYLRVLHFSSTAALTGEGQFNKCLKIVCKNVTSTDDAKEHPLTLVAFNLDKFDKSQRSVVFPPARPLHINYKSDLLQFQVQTLDNKPVALAAGGKSLLGVSLIQERPW